MIPLGAFHFSQLPFLHEKRMIPERIIYCPYPIVADAYRGVSQEVALDSVSATLSNNDLLDELRTAITAWFAVPTATGETVEWKDRNDTPVLHCGFG